MFRNVVLFFLMIAANCFYSNAQQVILSNENIDDPGYEHVKVIGEEENGFYLLQSNISLQTQRDRIGFKNRKYKISYYNYALQLKWTKKLEEENDQNNIDIVTMFRNHPLVITSQVQKNDNTITFFGQLLNADGNTFIPSKKVGTVKYDKGSDLEKPRFVVSHNESNAAIILEEDRDNDQVLHTLIIDSAMNLKAQQSPVISYPAKQLEVTDIVFADENELAAIGQSEEKNQDGQKGKTKKYKLFLLRKGESSFVESTISSGKKNITEAALSIDSYNKKVVVAGFYNDNDSYTGTGIIFASQALTNHSEIEIKTVIIDDNARVKMIGERNSGSNTGLFGYPIRKLILRSDGGAVVVAEAAYYSEYSYYDYFTQSFTRRTEYHYDNVIILSIHSNGTIDWSGVLRKSQETMDDGGFLSSFCSVLQSDRIEMVYNNEIGRNNEVHLYTINNKGISDQKVLTRSGQHIVIIPHSGKQVDENTLIAVAIQKKKLVLVKFEL